LRSTTTVSWMTLRFSTAVPPSGCIVLEMGPERVEAPLPCDPAGEHPVLDPPEGPCIEPTPAHAALLLPGHETGAGEPLTVLMDRRQRHRQRFRQVRHARRTTGQPLDDRPSGRVRESAERVIERAGLMVKHALKYGPVRGCPSRGNGTDLVTRRTSSSMEHRHRHEALNRVPLQARHHLLGELPEDVPGFRHRGEKPDLLQTRL